MSRLIYVPQYPAKMRYQEWWLSTFVEEFKKEYDEVYVVGFNFLWMNNPKSIDYDHEMFSPINNAIKFETAQIKDYMSLEIRDDDTLFLADISFPGLFCNVLYHKTCPKMYAFCHATSLNAYDYFAPMRKFKSKIEHQHARLFDAVFFGSYYSMNKVDWSRKGIKCVRTTLPAPPDNIIAKGYFERDIDIVSVCRPSIQKVNKKLEKKVERALGKKIHREDVSSWADYSALLSRSKVLLISTKEDTFNYTIMDAIRCGCVPIVPDKLCFPEILSGYWRYTDAEHLINKLKHMFEDNHFILPQIECQYYIDNFFENMLEEMKE
jgi:hypothetical protein